MRGALTARKKQKDDIEAWLDSLDPTTIEWRDATHLRRIAAARTAVERAERELRDAVLAAHRAGDSWTVIGMYLGVSKQAAHRRFAQPE